MDARRYFVICEDNCKFESMTKEQIIDAIAEATGSSPTPVDEAFITQIKEQNANHNLKMWKGTEAQYNALGEKDDDTLYIVGTNKVANIGEINAAVYELQEKAELLSNMFILETYETNESTFEAYGEGYTELKLNYMSGYTPIVVNTGSNSAQVRITRTVLSKQREITEPVPITIKGLRMYFYNHSSSSKKAKLEATILWIKSELVNGGIPY